MPVRDQIRLESLRGYFSIEVLRLCEDFGGSITSWYRTLNRNLEVGGATHSRHLDGLAADIVLDSVERKPACLSRAKEVFDFVLDEGDHIHVQVNP